MSCQRTTFHTKNVPMDLTYFTIFSSDGLKSHLFTHNGRAVHLQPPAPFVQRCGSHAQRCRVRMGINLGSPLLLPVLTHRYGSHDLGHMINTLGVFVNIFKNLVCLLKAGYSVATSYYVIFHKGWLLQYPRNMFQHRNGDARLSEASLRSIGKDLVINRQGPLQFAFCHADLPRCLGN